LKRLRSLRARLLAAGMLGTALVVAVAVGLMGRIHDDANARSFDRRIDAELALLIGMAEIDRDGALSLSREPGDDRYASPLSGQYWQIRDGERLLRSRSLWDAQLDDVAIAGDTGLLHWHDIAGPRGEPLRMASRHVRLPRAGRAIDFSVAADRSDLIEEARAFRGWVALVATALSIALLALAWTQMRFVLRPLRHLAQSVAAVRRGDAARLPDTQLPNEIAPLTQHLNDLLEQHERALAQARAATQDLAHALKTPLSVVAIEAAQAEPARRDAIRAQLARIASIVDRQLQGAVAADPRQRSDIGAVGRALIDAMRKIHGGRGIRFDADIPGDAVFAGETADLEEMIGNLLDNAGKWATTQVVLRAHRNGGMWTIDIVDDGPGLQPEQIEHALARGVRLDERMPGSGFGLAIVRQMAEGYGGSLRLESARPGLKAVLTLPAG
jgi:signal transduction histidine kinase